MERSYVTVIARGTWGVILAATLCLLWGRGSAAATAHIGHSRNPPQIEYFLVTDAHGKPRTSFTRGASVGFRIEVYSLSHSLGNVRSSWNVRVSGQAVRSWSHSGGFTGPTRGNLFHLTQTMKLRSHSRSGAYTASVSLSVQGQHLTRSARFYVRG